MRARRGVDVLAVALAIAGLAACVGPIADSSPPDVRPTSAAQCIDDDEPKQSGGRTAPPDTFGVQITYTPKSGQPSLPNRSPQPLNRGAVVVQ